MSAEVHPTTGDALLSTSPTCHLVCCNHPDTTLCGVEASEEDLTEEENCIVCIDLFEDSPEFCPMRPFCPFYVVPA